LKGSAAQRIYKKTGIKEFRVRDHSELARIEIYPDEFRVIMNNTVRVEIVEFLRSLGYRYVTLDLQGFRSGSANEALSTKRFKGKSG